MSEQSAKLIARHVAQELSMQGFLLEHEVTLRGDWNEAKVNKTLLYAVATKLNEQIAALLKAAAQE